MGSRANAAGVAAAVAILAATPLTAAQAGGSDLPNPVRSCRETPVFAHRGDADRYTENTRAAVRSAFELGAAAEVDVRTAADGTLVLMHNARVDRTTNGRGRVVDMTWPQLREHRTPDGLRIPRLRAVLRMVRDLPSAQVMLDLKHLTADSARALTSSIASFRIDARSQIISARYPLLNQVKALDPNLDTRIIARGNRPPVPTTIGRGHGVHIQPMLMTDAWVDAVNDAGIELSSDVADRLAAWRRAISAGAHGIVSNDPRGYLRACRRGRH